MKIARLPILTLALLLTIAAASIFGVVNAETSTASTYPVVDTGQTQCYNNTSQITCPQSGQTFYGQDAQNAGNAPNYTNNGNGTVTDNVTGLIWTQSPDLNGDGDIDVNDKLTYAQALASADSFSLAGYSDWRLPTIKELYSLIDFSGVDPSGYSGSDTSSLVPFIDTAYFDFGYGDTSAGERVIDAQFATSTRYVSTTMGGAETMFGVNFADGRIKGYPTGPMPGQSEGKLFYVLYVRGNTSYGVNNFVNNGDGTITDQATGLMWSQDDSGTGLNWAEALAWVQQKNAENYLGYSDWRLPDVKELQSIVDYSRSPDTTGSAAISPLFNVTAITNEAGQTDYPAYWSGTTHVSRLSSPGGNAAYVNFGRSMGYMNGSWMDVHGAGAQRSDPKSGDPADYPTGRGPQGDAIRIYNYVRLVRTADDQPATNTPTPEPTNTPTLVPTSTPTPEPTSTPTPVPTDTPTTVPTATPTALPTSTPTTPPTPTAEPTDDPNPQFLPLINSGGSFYTDGLGQAWLADQPYSLGGWGYLGGVARFSGVPVSGTADDALYQRWRDRVGEYRLSLPSGAYEVTLHFAEFEARRPGERRMQISMEGVVVENALDVLAQAGRATALEKTYNVNVSDGELTIHFRPYGRSRPPMVAAVEVR